LKHGRQGNKKKGGTNKSEGEVNKKEQSTSRSLEKIEADWKKRKRTD
jgi:hypothetical protein